MYMVNTPNSLSIYSTHNYGSYNTSCQLYLMSPIKESAKNGFTAVFSPNGDPLNSTPLLLSEAHMELF